MVDSLITVRSAEPDGIALPAAPALDALLTGSGVSRRAALTVTRAQASGRLVRVARRPLLMATLGAQRFDGDGGAFRLGPTIGASITLPFTTGRVNSGAASAAEGHIQAVQALGRAALARSRGDASAARDRYETARVRLALYDAALLRGARDERENALAAYRSGGITLLELLDFERALARAEIDRFRIRIDAGDALADLVNELTGEVSELETGAGLEDVR